MAKTFAKAIIDHPQSELCAIGSRSTEKAQALVQELGLACSYGSYEDLASDPNVDIVHVATPNSCHFDHAQLFLEHGKHVLCEKTFTCNAQQAQELINLARSRGCLLLEGMWTRFFPAMAFVKECVNSGAIGKLTMVRADLSVYREYDHTHRLFASELGGGALLDVGIYALSFASMILGNPCNVKSQAIFAPNGVDLQSCCLLSYDSGAQAVLSASLMTHSPRHATVCGTEGFLSIPDRWHQPQEVWLHRGDNVHQELFPITTSTGFAHEIDHVVQLLQTGQKESPVLPLRETVEIMKTIDAIRSNWDTASELN